MESDEWKFFIDRGENYTLREFFDTHKSDLPMLIIITQGHCGETEIESLPAFQVLQCHTYSRQKRLVARTRNMETISIPMTYPHNFRVIDTAGRPIGSPKPLTEITLHNHFPLKVEFVVKEDVSFTLNGEEKSIRDFNPITLTQTYDVTYITAFGVNETHIDDTPILVPLFLEDVLLSTIAGIKGKSNQEFINLLESFNTATGSISLTSAMYEDIALYSKRAVEVSENIYEFLQPDDYIRFKTRQTVPSPNEYEKLTNTVVEVRKKGSHTKGGFFNSLKQKILPKRHSLSIVTRESQKDICDGTTSKDLMKKRSSGTYAKLKVDGGTACREDGIYVKSQDYAYTKSCQTLPQNQTQRYSQTLQTDTHQYPRTTVVGAGLMLVSVKDLTVAEMAEKLKDLKLDHHMRSFRKNQVDGCLAIGLTEDILKWEFNFTTFEALKFMKFIQSGHIAR